jgi:hypothetical protein
MTCGHGYCGTCPNNTPSPYESIAYLHLRSPVPSTERDCVSMDTASEKNPVHMLLGTGIRVRLHHLPDSSFFEGIGAKCYILSDGQRKPDRESVILPDGYGHLYCPDSCDQDQVQSPHNSMTTLEDAVSTGMLTVGQKMEVAHLLVYGVIQLHAAPWIEKD